LDHVIIMNERHLKRLMAEYVRYYHGDRTHLGLRKERQQAGCLRTTPQLEAQYDLCRDSADCITATQWQRRRGSFS
jgi:hypothetical protein